MNEAALKLCQETPSLLKQRGNLLDLARQAVHSSGFQYAKKRSRSKALSENKDDEDNSTKRVKMSTELRQERIKELTEDVKDMNLQLSLFTKQREKNINSLQFQDAISVTDEMSKLKKAKREKDAELTLLLKKDAKSKNRKHSVCDKACNLPSKSSCSSRKETSNLAQKTLDALVSHQKKDEKVIKEVTEISQKTTTCQDGIPASTTDKTKHLECASKPHTAAPSTASTSKQDDKSFL